MVIDGRERGSLLGRLKSDGEWCVRDVWLWCMSVCCVLCACCAARYLPPVWSGCESVGEEMISIEICLMYWFLRIEISIRYVYIFWKIGLVRTVVSIPHCGCGDPGSIPGLDREYGIKYPFPKITFLSNNCVRTIFKYCATLHTIPTYACVLPNSKGAHILLPIYCTTSLVNSNGRTATMRLWLWGSSLSLIELR